MRHRHKKRHVQGDVELNLAAMLDMAFQLLAFFILTFRPTSVEGHLLMHMPPPVPQTNVESSSTDTGSDSSAEPPSEALNIYVDADAEGQVAEIRLSNSVVVRGRLSEMHTAEFLRRMKAIFSPKATLFDRVQITVDGQLRYEELMKVIDVCTQQKLADGTPLQKISFVERGGGEAAAP